MSTFLLNCEEAATNIRRRRNEMRETGIHTTSQQIMNKKYPKYSRKIRSKIFQEIRRQDEIQKRHEALDRNLMLQGAKRADHRHRKTLGSDY